MTIPEQLPFKQFYCSVDIYITMNRAVVFIVTMLASQAFYGQMGAFSMIKEPLKEEFEFSETFLGLLDALTQLGMFIGNFLLLLFPLPKPKRDFFFSVTLQSLLSLLLICAKVMNAEMIFAVIVLILGILKAACFVPVIVMNRSFDPESQAFCVNIWMAFFSFGDLFSLLCGQLLMNQFGWNWAYYMVFTSLVFFFVGLLFYCLMEEVPIDLEKEVSFADNLHEKVRMIKETFAVRKKFLVIIDFTLLQALFYNCLMWYPYFFILIGYDNFATYLTCTFVFSTLIGTLTFESLIKYSGVKADVFMIGTLTLMVLFQVAFLIVYATSEDNDKTVIVYFIICFFLGLTISGPWIRICSSETMESGEGDPVGLYYVLATQAMTRCLFSFISLFVIGALMDYSQNSFFVFLVVNALVQLIFTTIHRCCKKEEKVSQKEESTTQSLL